MKLLTLNAIIKGWRRRSLTLCVGCVLCALFALTHRRREETLFGKFPTERLVEPRKEVAVFRRLSDHIILYSVILDLRNGNMDYSCVRILAVVHSNKSNDVICRFANDSSLPVKALFYELAENHHQLHGVFVLSCKIPSSIQPDAVRSLIVQRTSNNFSVAVSVDYIARVVEIDAILPLKYGICVPVLFGDRYRAENLVEFMEINRLLGAEHVFIYVKHEQLDEKMKRAIKYYEKKGFLSALEFLLPFDDYWIWYHGQLLVIQDCLYRNIGFTNYLAFHDLDELFVPYSTDNILSLLDNLFNVDWSLGSVRIPTTYFQTSTEDFAHPPVTVNQVMASEENETRLTKCVVRPSMVFDQGIHHTSRLVKNHYKTLELSREVGRMHHYKENHPGTIKNDRISTIFGERLLTAYEQTLNELKMKFLRQHLHTTVESSTRKQNSGK